MATPFFEHSQHTSNIVHMLLMMVLMMMMMMLYSWQKQRTQELTEV